MLPHLPQDILREKILAKLFPADIVSIRQTSKEFYFHISNDEKYIDSICRHIEPHGEMKRYNPSTGLLEYEYFYKEGKLHGEYKRWHENGTIDYIYNYNNGVFHGEIKNFYSNGHPFHMSVYIHGKLSGASVQYRANGMLWKLTMYKNGLKRGKANEWYPSGKLETVTNYRNDRRHKASKEYYPNGNLRQKRIYTNGNLLKECRWDENGKLECHVLYDTIDGISNIRYARYSST